MRFHIPLNMLLNFDYWVIPHKRMQWSYSNNSNTCLQKKYVISNISGLKHKHTEKTQVEKDSKRELRNLWDARARRLWRWLKQEWARDVVISLALYDLTGARESCKHDLK